MATISDYNALRRDTSTTILTLSDVDAEAFYAEAATLYTGAAAQRAGARVLVLTAIVSGASRLHDYVQNNTQEKASQVFDHLMKLLEYWQGQLDDALQVPAASASAMSMRVPVVAVW